MHQTTRRGFLRSVAAAGVAVGASPNVWAQAFPSKPVKYLLGFAAGGTTDMVARLVNPSMTAALGQSVVIEYYPGAGGVIAVERGVRAAPDGYTVLHLSSDFATVTPHLVKIDYDPLKDLEPIVFYGSAVQVLAVKPGLPVSNAKDFIEYARANPGKLTYGSSGTATGNHITTEYLKQAAGIQAVHVPYRGAAPAIQDLIAGTVDFVIDPGLLPAIKSGKIKAVAIVDAPSHPMLPDVQYLGVAVPSWSPPQWFHYAAVPAKTPQDVRDRLGKAASQWKADPALRAKLGENSIVVSDLTPAQVRAKVSEENQRIGALIKSADIRLT